MDASVDQTAGDLEMPGRGHGDARASHTADNRTGVAYRLGAKFARHCPGPRLVDIDDGDQFRRGIGSIVRGMKAPEVPRPHDGDRNRICHIPSPEPYVAETLMLLLFGEK